MRSLETGSRPRGRKLRLERWLPQLVVSPIFALSLFFVYGFIAWTIYISFTRSRMMPVYDLVGLAQYERLWATPRWHVALENLFVFGGLFIAGCLIIGLMLIVAFQFAIGRQEAIPQVLIAVVVQSLVGLVIFWICSLIWIGFDEPFHINVLRLLAIYAISWAALLVAASLPPLLCSAIIFVPAGIFVLLHKKMLDLDLADAALVAVFTGIVWVAVFVVILGQTYL